MPAPHLQVRGADRLRRTLKRAGVDLDELKAVNRDVAGIVTRAARPPQRTGRLAATVRPGATRRAAIVRAGRATVPYAGVIHWGWPRRNITAQPFLSRAATATEPRWTAVYFRRVETIIDKIKGL